MKYYCIETETCGWYKHEENESLEDSSICCPVCFGFVLVYEDYEVPSWVKESAPHGAVFGEVITDDIT